MQGWRREILESKLSGAGLGKSKQVGTWSATGGRRREILESKLLGAGLGKAGQLEASRLMVCVILVAWWLLAYQTTYTPCCQIRSLGFLLDFSSQQAP